MRIQQFQQLCLGALAATQLVTYPLSAEATVNQDPAIEKAALDYYSRLVQIPNGAFFDAPEGWAYADPSIMNENLKILVAGKGKHVFPPTINLSQEIFEGTIKEYLEIAKRITSDRGGSWRRIGTVKTAAGKATLAQSEVRTECGDTKMLHAFLIHRGIIHIVTAAAAKDEFSNFYDTFFAAIKSLRINQSPEEMITDPSRRAALNDACAVVKTRWQETKQAADATKRSSKADREQMAAVFKGEEFQNGAWKTFSETVDNEFAEMDTAWHDALLQVVRSDLLTTG